jgi:hypothetical protein
MSRYYLTEAYGELYNPRKTDETFYENLKFVDYLLDEQIEEVMESLFWEFMDYGNTLDESYNLIENTFSDGIILEEVLLELNPYAPAGSAAARQYNRATSHATRRRQERVARVTGAIKNAGKSVQSAAAGVGSAVSKAATGTYNRAAGLAGKAKAALTGLVRKGAFAVGSKMRQAGEKIEKSGKAAASAPAVTRSANIGGRRHTYVSEPTPETGGKRRAIGSAIKGIADRLIKSGAERTKLPPRTHITSASRVPPSSPLPSTPKSTPKVNSGSKYYGPSTGDVNYYKPTSLALGTKKYSAPKFNSGSEVSTTKGNSSTKSAPKSTSTTSTPADNTTVNQGKTGRVHRRHGKLVSGARPSTPSTPSTQQKPKATTRKIGRLKPPTPEQQEKINNIKAAIAEREATKKAAKNKPVAENYELLTQYILEDLINEGYADDFESAMVILENLSDDVVEELALQYLED